MEDALLVVVAVVVSAVLSAAAYRLRCLTLDGAAASFLTGAFVGIFSTFGAFVLLIVFTVAGFAATKHDFDRKAAEGLQEGRKGERTWKNVLGVGVPPCLAAAVFALGLIDDVQFAVFFVSTVAVAGADTIASEIGFRDKRTYMITTFERVEPGVNGGVSALGTSVSTVAALLIAALGWLLVTGGLDWLLLIPFAMGVVGNLLDSVFGAVLENPGRISKYTNNCSTAVIGGLLGILILALLRRRGPRGGAGHNIRRIQTAGGGVVIRRLLCATVCRALQGAGTMIIYWSSIHRFGMTAIAAGQHPVPSRTRK